MRRSLAVFGPVLRNGDLRPVLAAFAGFQAAEFAVWVAMLVYAFDRGGTTTAAVVAVVQLVPSAIAAPIGGALADRYPAARVLALGYLGQALTLGVTAVAILADGPPVLAYALSAVAAAATTITRPTQAVLLPEISRRPVELTAANVVTGWIETSMALAGPAVAGAILAVFSPGLVFAVFAAVTAISTVLVLPLALRTPARPGGVEAAVGPREELAAGFRAIMRSPPTRVLVGALSLAYVVWGAFDVLAVVLAIDVLDIGNAGAGYLTAAFGAGSIAGAFATVALVGRRRLVPPLLLAALLWGVAFAFVGFSSKAWIVFALLVAAGAGQALLEVAGRTLLQRISPPDVLARIFGIHEGLTMCALAIGSILVPPLVALGGAELAFAATGALLPAFVLLFYRRLMRVDAAATVPIVEISLLRTTRIFGLLTPPALEGVARNLVPLAVPAGKTIIQQGDEGDRYYVIAGGQVQITIDGAPVARLGRGEGFGEVALLRNAPRTATVTAAVDTDLYALDREPFLIEVTGHAGAAAEAEAVADERARAPA